MKHPTYTANSLSCKLRTFVKQYNEYAKTNFNPFMQSTITSYGKEMLKYIISYYKSNVCEYDCLIQLHAESLLKEYLYNDDIETVFVIYDYLNEQTYMMCNELYLYLTGNHNLYEWE